MNELYDLLTPVILLAGLAAYFRGWRAKALIVGVIYLVVQILVSVFQVETYGPRPENTIGLIIVDVITILVFVAMAIKGYENDEEVNDS